MEKDLYFCKPKFTEMSGIFTIPLGGLKEGCHTFDFEISKEFFDLFEESEIKEGELVAITEVERRSSHIDLVIRISGKVRICCDRCLELFDQLLEFEDRILVKFGIVSDDSDPEIVTVPADEHELDMKQYFYEFIHLALPIKRMHPVDKKGNSTCDPAMLQKLEEHLVDDEKENDPRWDELKKLINDN